MIDFVNMRLFRFIVFFMLFSISAYGQLHLGELRDTTFYSQALNKNTTLRVYLPPRYDPDNQDKKYPLIIFLHGATVTYDTYRFILPMIDAMWLQGSIKHFILAMPDGSAPPFNGSFYTNSALYGNYEDLITKDILKLLDENFNTFPDRKFRAIMGHSMGAYGAFKQAFRHPALFSVVAGLSGPVHIEMLDMLLTNVMEENDGPPYDWKYSSGKGLTNLFFTMAGAFSPDLESDLLVKFPLDQNGQLIGEVMNQWNAHNIVEMVRWHSPMIPLNIYFDCGQQDEYKLYMQNRALSDSLKAYGIRHQYVEYSGNHTNRLPLRIPKALQFIDSAFHQNQPYSLQNINPVKEIVTLFPNPVSEYLFYTAENEENLLQIYISGLKGRILRSYSPDSHPVPVADLPDGLYLIHFQFHSGISSQKFIKIH